jgi:hypothetical protein
MSEAQKASVVQNAMGNTSMAQPTTQPWVTPQATQPVSNPVSPVQIPQGMARPNYGLLAQQNYQAGQNSVPNQMRNFYQRPGFDPNQFAQTVQAQKQFAQQLQNMANAPVKPMFKPVVNSPVGAPAATNQASTSLTPVLGGWENYVG